MTRFGSRRPGVGLVELLVALSIISLLLALLLPAVQKVRVAAAKLACASNLRQVGIAAHHCDSVTGSLPPAFQRRTWNAPYPNLQWPIHLTPYLELDANWRMAQEDFHKSRDALLPTPHRGLSIPLKPFSCPSDPKTATDWPVTFAYSLAQPQPQIMTPRVALNSYLGNAGAFSKRQDGVILVDGRVGIANISDGASNTLAFGERPPPRSMICGWVYVGWGSSATGNGELASVIGVRDPNPLAGPVADAACGPGPFPYRQPDLTAKADCAVFQYWSLHPGGANFAFCDGSVRFLSYSADSILPSLATRAGGEAIELP